MSSSLPWNKPERVYFVSGPKQGLEMEAVVLHRVGFLEYFLSFTGSRFQTLGGTPIPKLGSSTHPHPPRHPSPGCDEDLDKLLNNCTSRFKRKQLDYSLSISMRDS